MVQNRYIKITKKVKLTQLNLDRLSLDQGSINSLALIPFLKKHMTVIQV